MNKRIPINLIDFNIGIGKTKPRTINGEKQSCPFCNTAALTNIVDTKDDMIFLHNKYNVLEPSEQFVLIEGAECDADMPDYSKEKMSELIRFGLYHWFNLLESQKYQAVLFFKNYGPLSGGTIRHPHMQIVGLPTMNPDLMFNVDEFEGIPVASDNNIEINIATLPRIGFCEINIIVNRLFSSNQLKADLDTAAQKSVDTLAKYLQCAIGFMKDFFKRDNFSYNIFFYLLDGYIRIKLLPRFATSPLYIGYNIHLRPTNIQQTADLLNKYISSH